MSVLKPDEYQATFKRSYTAAESDSNTPSPPRPAPAPLAGIVGRDSRNFIWKSRLHTWDCPWSRIQLRGRDASWLCTLQSQMAAHSPWQVTHLPAAGTGLLWRAFYRDSAGLAGVTFAERNGCSLGRVFLHIKANFWKSIGVGFSAEASFLGNARQSMSCIAQDLRNHPLARAPCAALLCVLPLSRGCFAQHPTFKHHF